MTSGETGGMFDVAESSLASGAELQLLTGEAARILALLIYTDRTITPEWATSLKLAAVQLENGIQELSKKAGAPRLSENMDLVVAAAQAWNPKDLKTLNETLNLVASELRHLADKEILPLERLTQLDERLQGIADALAVFNSFETDEVLGSTT